MKRVFRVKYLSTSKAEIIIYLIGKRAREVREQLVRNGVPSRDILSTTAIADAEPGPNGVGPVR